MFSLFVNDIETFLQQNSVEGYNLDQLILYLFLFADDSVLISETPDGLQNLIDSFKLYCDKWKLTVNVSKTKVVAFKKGRLPANLNFAYGDSAIELVDCFNYLGVVLTKTVHSLTQQKLYQEKL